MPIGIRGSFTVGFVTEHRLLKYGIVIFEGTKIKYVGKSARAQSGHYTLWLYRQNQERVYDV
jgi:hypothetical protein